MGVKQIWDGEDLPPVGCEVLVHLARCDVWVPHKVTGFRVKGFPVHLAEEGGTCSPHLSTLFSVEVLLAQGKDPRASLNMRFLDQVFPLDADPLDLPVKGCLPSQREAEKVKKEKATKGKVKP